MKQIKRIMGIDPWKITSNQIEKEDRRLQESLTSIGNGYMGMRGNFSETYSGDSHQGTYIEGVITNVDFQLELISDPHVVAGDYDTSFLGNVFLPEYQKED